MRTSKPSKCTWSNLGRLRAASRGAGACAVLLTLAGCIGTPVADGMDPIRLEPMMNGMDIKDGVVTLEDANAVIVVTVTQGAHDELTGGKRIRPLSAEEAPGYILPAGYRAYLKEYADRYGLERIADWPLPSLGARCLVFTTSGAMPRDEVLAQLARDPRVEIAQPLNLFATRADGYNDPYVELQHGFRSLQIQSSHRFATGAGVVVAVVDTGMDIRHPDLRDRVVGARNFVDRDDENFIDDVHGTAVAAVIGASANNGAGIVGVAPDVGLLALKGCWERSTADGAALCSTFTLAKSIDFAITQQADIINLSLGGPADPLLGALVERALAKGLLVVGAYDPQHPDGFPAHVADVLSVSESENGNAAGRHSITAPGRKVFSAKPEAQYDFFSGSSLSAAHVSGVLALMRERRPHLSAREVGSLFAAPSAVTRGVSDPSGNHINGCRLLTTLIGAGDC